MSKLRNVQFYRNTTPSQYDTHALARAAAEARFTSAFLADMKDGELVFFRYTIEGENGSPVHTIVAAVRNDGANRYAEFLANNDELAAVAKSGTAADVTYVNATSGLAATNVQAAIDEVKGRVDALETSVGEINAVYGVKINDVELEKDGNKKVNIVTEGTYNSENNKIATESTVANAIEGKLTALNGTAGIASASDGVVTLKAGVIQTDGKIANSSDSDIILAKVATTGEAEDVVKSTATTANYDVTSGEISQTWINTVTGNAIAVGDTVDADINKLDSKIAGLADELIRDEQVINASVNSIKESVGLENDLSLSLSGDTTSIIASDTNVKAALLDLAAAIGTGSSNVKDVKIDNVTILDSNGVADIQSEGDSYNASTNPFATVSTVNTAVGTLNTVIGNEFAALDANSVMGVVYTAASGNDGAKLTFKGVSQEDGLIKQGVGTDELQLAKVATTGSAEDVTLTYNSVSGTVLQTAVTDMDSRIKDLEALPTYDVVVVPSGENFPTASADTMYKIYLKALDPEAPEGDVYEEYITLRSGSEGSYTYSWEKLGTTAASLEGYVKTVNINGKDYNVPASSTTVTLGDYITDITTNGATYVNAVVGTAVKNTTNGTVTLPITINEKIQALSTADSSNMGLAEASDVKSYVDTKVNTTIGDLDKANSTVGTNVQVSYEEVDGIVTITNVAGPNANPTSDDAAVANVQVIQTDGAITDVVVTNNSADVVYNATAGTLTANTATGAVTGGDIATIKDYIDAKAGAATLTEGDGIDITSNVVKVDLAPNATQGSTTTPSSTASLLIIDSNHQLSISDTWDCGVY